MYRINTDSAFSNINKFFCFCDQQPEQKNVVRRMKKEFINTNKINYLLPC